MRGEIDERSDGQHQYQARGDLGHDEFRGAQGRGPQPLEKAVLAVTHDDVADAEKAAEHHVHAEYARQYPVDVADRVAADLRFLHAPPDRRVRLQQQPFGNIARRRFGIDPVAAIGAETHEQVEAMPLHFAESVRFVGDRHELDVAGLEKRMLARVDLARGLQHAHGVLVAALAAEDEGEPEDQYDGHEDIPRQRPAVANELAIASEEHGVDALQHGLRPGQERSEWPVRSRNRSSRFGCRILMRFRFSTRGARASRLAETSVDRTSTIPWVS